MLDSSLQHLPDNRATLLNNVTCPYCGGELDRKSATKDHVVGRRFVPKGTLDGGWNLILRACKECNSGKADLEDDLSAITMQPDAAGVHATDDVRLVAEASRKARKSVSRRTGKTVAKSRETMTFKMPFGANVEFTFTAIAPPQVREERAFGLARLQLAAIFYFVTYNYETKLGGFWPGSFYPLSVARKSDWGNEHLRTFSEQVKHWEPRFIGTLANGYFRGALRRHPNAMAWSWALEWNQSHRVAGFLGELAPVQALVDEHALLDPRQLAMSGNDNTRYRTEVPLQEDTDALFAWGGASAQIEP